MTIVLTIAVVLLAAVNVVLYMYISKLQKITDNLLAALQEQENINRVCFIAIADLQSQIVEEAKASTGWSGPIGQA